MKWQAPLLLGAMFVLAACQPGELQGDESANGTVRNVIAQVAGPQPLEVSIKLPVLIRPDDEYELRSAAGGNIISLPYEKGDIVPAGSIPEAKWIEAEEFIAAQPEGSEPTAEQIDLRNLAHLQRVDAFARVNDRQLIQSLREAQQSYDQAVRGLRRLQEYPDSTGAELDQARTRRNMARVAAERALAMLEDTYLCSPARGVLTERTRRKGEYVNPGELIGRIAVMERLVAVLEIPEAHREALNKGDELEIAIGSLEDADGEAETRTGTIVRIDHVAHSETHSFSVEIEIPNEDLTLPAGIFGTTRVVTYKRSDALVVPLSAINLNAEERSVFVVNEDNTVSEFKNLDIGHMTREWVEIRNNGLRGKRVVTFGAQNLSDGDRVNWTDEDPYIVKKQPSGESKS